MRDIYVILLGCLLLSACATVSPKTGSANQSSAAGAATVASEVAPLIMLYK